MKEKLCKTDKTYVRKQKTTRVGKHHSDRACNMDGFDIVKYKMIYGRCVFGLIKNGASDITLAPTWYARQDLNPQHSEPESDALSN